MTYRELFEVRKALAHDFRHGMCFRELKKKYGNSVHFTSILKLEIPEEEYERIARHHRGQLSHENQGNI